MMYYVKNNTQTQIGGCALDGRQKDEERWEKNRLLEEIYLLKISYFDNSYHVLDDS